MTIDNQAVSYAFKWKGIVQSGEKRQGFIHAPTIELAKSELRKQGIVTRKITKKQWRLFDKAIKPIDITQFTRQMATLIKAGIPLTQSLEIIESGQNKQEMKALIKTIKQQIETGLMVAECLRKHPSYFNALNCSMIDAGEQSGTLDVMLDKLAIHNEKVGMLKQKIKDALTYPTIVLFIAMVVTSGLLIIVIPQFESLFSNFDATLPAPTQFIIDSSHFLIQWWAVILSCLGIFYYLLIHLYIKKFKFKYALHGIILNTLGIGDIIKKSVISRFLRTLSITLSAGLPLTDGLNTIIGVTGNLVYAQATQSIKLAVSKGQSLHNAIIDTKLFPCLVSQMIAIGEESGTLDDMLNRIADVYDDEINHAIKRFNGLFEPLIMSVLGLFIGGLIIAIYLPILQLGTVV